MISISSEKAIARMQAIIIAAIIVIASIAGGLYYYFSRSPVEEKLGQIKLGVILPLTGRVADAGQWLKSGYDMALEEINKEGIRIGDTRYLITLIYEDSAAVPATTVSAAEKLINYDNVLVIMGEYTSDCTMALIPVTKKYNQLSVLTGGSADSVVELPHQWMFHLHPLSKHYQTTMVSFYKEVLIPKMGLSKVRLALAYEDTNMGKDQSGRFLELIKNVPQVEVITVEVFTPGSVDYSSMLTKIKGLNPDIFHFIAVPGDAILITRQCKEQDFTPNF